MTESALRRGSDEWTYFCGVAPVFRHPEADRRSFRMFTAQLICQGACRQSDVVRAFGVSANSVKRSVKKYRAEGIASFFQPRAVRGGTVLTDEVTRHAQELLDRGRSRREVAEELGVKGDTLRKAIQQGRLRESAPTAAPDMTLPPASFGQIGPERGRRRGGNGCGLHAPGRTRVGGNGHVVGRRDAV